MKRIFLLSTLMFLGLSLCLNAQKRNISEFMEAAGFKTSGVNEWVNANGAKVETEGDYLKGFSAPQTHNWRMVFGDGATFGTTISVKVGENINFKDGIITFPNGLQFKLLSKDDIAMTNRGLVKSAIFNKDRDILNATDVKIVNPENYSIGWILKGEEEKALDENGNFVELVLAERKIQAEKQKKANSAWEQAKQKNEDERSAAISAKYEEYCNKYGKDKIDDALNGNIVVGLPWDFNQKILTKFYLYTIKKVSSGKSWDVYRVEPFLLPVNDWHEVFRVRVDPTTDRILWWSKYWSFNAR